MPLNIVYLDGAFLPEAEAKIPVHNRGFLFGDGVYATIQVHDGKPLFLETHLQRLIKQAKHFGLQPPHIKEDEIYELIEKNGAQEGIWKLKVIVVGGEEPEMRLPQRQAGHLLFLLHPFSLPPYEPLQIASFPTPVVTAHTSFKSLAHLSRYFVMEHGLSIGCHDAFTMTEGRTLLECAFGNLFWIAEGKLFTPDPSLPLHFGVTISQVVEMAQEMGLGVTFMKISLEEIPEKAFLYRCNTMSGIRPVKKIGLRLFERSLSLEEELLERYALRAGIKKAAL